MKKTLLIFSLLSLLTACELFVIGTKKEPVIEISQNSPIGTILLFKTKLDSNKIPDASALMLKQDGSQYLAIEKVDLFEDLKKLNKQISKKSITRFSMDTISAIAVNVSIEFEYIRNYKFNTMKKADIWFITGYKKH